MLKISCICVKMVLAIDSKGESTPETLEQISYISTEQDEILIIYHQRVSIKIHLYEKITDMQKTNAHGGY